MKADFRNLNRAVKWIADLTEAMLVALRRQDEQATPPELRPAFTAKVALADVGRVKTLAGLAQQSDAQPTLIRRWQAQLLEEAANVFGAGPATGALATDITVLHAKIGGLTLANDFFADALGKAGPLQGGDRP